MAKSRMVNTRFWDDSYISGLDPIEKLMFIYLLTNPQTNICGIYELAMKKIALDTGIDKEMVEKIVKRFTKEKKIFYIKGWVCIKNFIKHQNSNSPLVKKGIENELNLIPSHILEEAKGYGYGMDTISHLIESNLTKSNLIKSKEASQSSAEISELIKLFEEVNPACKKFYGNTTQRKACQNLIEEYTYPKVAEVIGFLNRSNKMPFMPAITTPQQLWDKWSALESGLKKKKGEVRMRERGLEL